MPSIKKINTVFSGTATALWPIDEKNQLGSEECPVTFHTHYNPCKEI